MPHGARFGVSSAQRAWAVRPIVGKALEQHHSCRQGCEVVAVVIKLLGIYGNWGISGGIIVGSSAFFVNLTSSLQPLEPMSRQRLARVDEVHVGR